MPKSTRRVVTGHDACGTAASEPRCIGRARWRRRCLGGDGISPRATQTTPYGSSLVVREQQLATVFRSAARIYTNGQGLERNALGVTPMIRRNVRLNVDRSPNP
jgi:hypothetical protein